MNRLVLIFIFFFAWILLLYATATLESAGDGWDMVGFPFTFYKYTAAKGPLAANEREMFSVPLLAADLLLMILCGVCVFLVYKKRWKK